MRLRNILFLQIQLDELILRSGAIKPLQRTEHNEMMSLNECLPNLMVNNYTESTNGLFISWIILRSLFIATHKSDVLVCRQCWHLFSVQVRCFMYAMNCPISRFPMYVVEFCFYGYTNFSISAKVKNCIIYYYSSLFFRLSGHFCFSTQELLCSNWKHT